MTPITPTLDSFGQLSLSHQAMPPFTRGMARVAASGGSSRQQEGRQRALASQQQSHRRGTQRLMNPPSSSEPSESNTSDSSSSDDDRPQSGRARSGTRREVETSQLGLQYSNSYRTIESRVAAHAAFSDAQSNVVSCGTNLAGTGYFFDISTGVRIDVNSAESPPACTCRTARLRGACSHIYWLWDQTLFRLPASMKGRCYSISADGSAVARLNEVGVWSQGITLSALVSGLARRRLSAVFGCDHSTLDALSIFEPSGLLPHEFAAIDPHTPSPGNSRETTLFRNYANQVLVHAMIDIAVRQHMSTLITPETKVLLTLNKIRKRITKVFLAYDLTTYGYQGEHETLDVPTCAIRLRDVVHSIDALLEYLPEDERSSERMRFGLAQCLILGIVGGLLGRRNDAYPTGTRAGFAEGPEQRSIYLYTLVRPQTDLGMILLQVLDRIAATLVTSIRERVDGSEALLEHLIGGGAFAQFTSGLRIIINQQARRSVE